MFTEIFDRKTEILPIIGYLFVFFPQAKGLKLLINFVHQTKSLYLQSFLKKEEWVKVNTSYNLADCL
jgi:hypothetical protein